MRAALAADYRERITSPFTAAELGLVDDVILPEETRDRLVSALRMSARPQV
jgi:acetyl-CoA carboxylase carboxyltransferase component